MNRPPPPEPTAEQCSAHERFKFLGNQGIYVWYPQMGGYVGKAAVIRMGDPGACVDVFVWHDGEFPFGDEDQKPREIHHCDAAQFVRFGKTVADFQGEPPLP